ncbi:MAG: DUF92 domain-containing protein [Anaerolineae bacterium]|nr:DUF92 domain-containing protein [Anaerolineae bacterium]
MSFLLQIIVGLILSSLIGFLAYWRGSLTRSGAAGAVIIGTVIFGFGGWAWGLTLIAFFVTSSLLSHYKESTKENLAEKFAKGHRRDLGQALANGGAGALIAVLYAVRPDPLLAAAFAGAMATVNADTWATELGVLARKPPRLITSGRPAEVGTSGAVSVPGMLASVAGASTIGIALVILLRLECVVRWSPMYALLNPCPFELALLPGALIGGLIGSLFDSLLGATVQAIYYCPTCKKETEKTRHSCGTLTQQMRGWQWLNNDMVNFISSLVGALVGAVFHILSMAV